MRWYRDFYPRSRPRVARGGIKAQSTRGSFGSTWWGRRWVEVLEGFDIGARLQRGRSYARGGQVLSIDVTRGAVKAKVQGSMSTPYGVKIELATLSDKDWSRAVEALGGQALYTAKLLAGEMPEEIEAVFTTAGLSLFPRARNDLKTDCSCPDYSNPCKHIAAVYYLLAEEFDRDPFLLFRLRGLERDELFRRLGEFGATPSVEAAAQPDDDVPIGEPLPTDAAAFWSTGPVPEDLFADVAPPPVAAARVKQLGGFPFWRGEVAFVTAMEEAYAQAAERGQEVFVNGARRNQPG